MDNNFIELSNNINCTEWGNNPIIYDELFFDNHYVTYEHNSIGDKWICLQGKRFNKINAVIEGIILNRQEIKKLVPSDIAYE